ncbi:hypothetical protein ABFV47_07525 [Mycolicibacterium fortuitum]
MTDSEEWRCAVEVSSDVELDDARRSHRIGLGLCGDPEDAADE